MLHWREEFEKLGIGTVAEAMVEEREAPATGRRWYESSSYEDAVSAIEEAESITGGELPEPFRLAMLQRAVERDETRVRRARGSSHFRDAMAAMEAA